MALTKWKIDPAHSEIQFKVKHLMITTIVGRFHTFDLEVLTEDDDFTQAYGIEFTAEVNSISTQNQQRDEHLKSAEFFDTDKYGTITFSGKKFEKGVDEFLLHGELTIKDVTKEVALHVDFGGIAVDPYNLTRAGFTITGKISRKEFGLTWSAVTEAGQVVVSDEIRIGCEVELIKT
jgi:polyisoprenoid-binding protein YceI